MPTKTDRWAVLAPLSVALITARVLQGVFGALLAPAALSTLTVTFAGTEDWNKAFGSFGAVAGGGGAIGLLLGGVMTQLISWRWCLYVNVVIAVPTTLIAFRLLVNTSDPDRPRIDIPGVLTWTVGLFALVFGFSNAETHGWGATATWGSCSRSRSSPPDARAGRRR